MLRKLASSARLPVVEAGGEKSLGRRPSGVGDADVDAAKLGGHGGNEAADGSGIGHVEGLGEDFHGVLFSDLLRRGLQRLLVARAHGDAAAFGGKGFGRGEAESLTGRGNQRDAILQSHIHRESISVLERRTGIINGALFYLPRQAATITLEPPPHWQ